MFLHNFWSKLKSTSVVKLYITIALIGICDFIYFLKTQQYSLAILGVLACMSLLFLPIFLFKNHIKLYLRLLLPIFILLPLNFGSTIIYGIPINDSIIYLILNKNFQEATELLSGYLFIIIISIIIYVVALFILFSKIPNTIPSKTSYYLSSISLFILLLLPLFDKETKAYFSNLRARLYTTFPISLVYASKITYAQYQLARSSKDERENFKFNAKQDINIDDKQVSVLIIGESSRYDHWAINGYSKNTSPRLSKRENLISFKNVTTGGFITEYAVPLILTGVGADSFNKHYQQKSIVSAFEEAGFSTYWLTTQVDEGHISIHIKEAQKQYTLVSDSRATKNVHRDMELLTPLKKILATPDKKKFIVLHTNGSHYDYSVRYPDEFDVFKPSNKTVTSASADKRFKNVLVNSYDNSILYSDAVIDSVISLVSSQNAYSFVTYISDHGENLFDDNRNLSQHAYPIPSKYVAHIPYFIWYSPLLEKTFSNKITNLKSNINAKISSKSVIHTLTSLGGISYSRQDSSKNLASPYYKDSKQLILGANNKAYFSPNLK